MVYMPVEAGLIQLHWPAAEQDRFAASTARLVPESGCRYLIGRVTMRTDNAQILAHSIFLLTGNGTVS